jgi:hypothetical protein
MTEAKMRYGITIGDISFRFTSEDTIIKPVPYYDAFLSADTQPDIDIQVHSGLPDIKPGQMIFDSGSVWKMYNWQDKYLFTFSSPVPPPRFIYSIAVFTKDFARGDIYFIKFTDRESIDPIAYPLDELLTVNYLAQGRGIEVHSLGVGFDNLGLSFIGVSGAGKSTLAELWKKRKVDLLSDDRIIFRKNDGVFWMYGTPWHGDARISLAKKLPLHGVYFLKQAKVNRVTRLDINDAAKRLVVRCFPTLYNTKGMDFTMEFITELVQKVPCYELQFTPEQQAIDEVINNVRNSKL